MSSVQVGVAVNAEGIEKEAERQIFCTYTTLNRACMQATDLEFGVGYLMEAR